MQLQNETFFQKDLWKTHIFVMKKVQGSNLDSFSQVYANQLLNRFMIVLYIIGLFGCLGLSLVSWFERSGQAGPYRTLVNQLVSINLDQVILIAFMYYY